MMDDRIRFLESIRGKIPQIEKEIWSFIHTQPQHAYGIIAQILGLSPLQPLQATELLPDGTDPSEKTIQPFQITGKRDAHLFGESTVIKKYNSAEIANNCHSLITWFATRQPHLVSKEAAVITNGTNSPAFLVMRRIPGSPGHYSLSDASKDDTIRLKQLEMLVDAAATLQTESTQFRSQKDLLPAPGIYTKKLREKLEPVKARGANIESVIKAAEPHEEKIMQADEKFLFLYLDLGPQNFLFSHSNIGFQTWPTGLMKIDFDELIVRCGIADVLTIIQSPYSRMKNRLKRQQRRVEKYLFNRWLAHLFGPVEAAMMNYEQHDKLARAVQKVYNSSRLAPLCESESIIRNLTIAGDKAREQQRYSTIISALEEELGIPPDFKEKHTLFFPGELEQASKPGALGEYAAPLKKEDYFTPEERAQIPMLRYKGFVVFNEWLKQAEAYHLSRAIKIAEKCDRRLANKLMHWKLPRRLLSVPEIPRFGEALFRERSDDFLRMRMLETAMEQYFHYRFDAE